MFQCDHPSTPDEVTLLDCQKCLYRPKPVMSDAKKYILVNHLSPGDVLAMSAAIYSIKKQYPGKYEFAVDTTGDPLYEHNPDVVLLERAKLENWEIVQTHYDAINLCNQRGVHFLAAYCEFFENLWGIKVPLLTNRPMIYLTDQEKAWLPQVQERTGRPTRYWVVNAGRKSCYTSKFWGTRNYQEVVNLLRGKVLFVQVGSAEHHHPPLENVMDLRGKTDLRQLVRLVYHADGVLGPVSLTHHLAAALEKPAVTLMGGREPVQWNAYPKCQLMHTVGALDCCKDGGCWRSRTVKLGDGDSKDESLCEHPLPLNGEFAPKCLMLVGPREVADKVLLYG